MFHRQHVLQCGCIYKLGVCLNLFLLYDWLFIIHYIAFALGILLVSVSIMRIVHSKNIGLLVGRLSSLLELLCLISGESQSWSSTPCMLLDHSIMYLYEFVVLPFNRTCNGGRTSWCQNFSWIVTYFLSFIQLEPLLLLVPYLIYKHKGA